MNGGIIGVDAESPVDAVVRLARHSSIGKGIDTADIEGMLNDRADILVQVLTLPTVDVE